MWQAIQYVSSGFTLAAFVVAVIAWVLKSRSEARERLIDLAKEEERAGLVRDALEFFRVDTAGLTRAQQYQLALEQIRARAQRFKIIAIVVCLIAGLGTGIAAYAITRVTAAAASRNPVAAAFAQPKTRTLQASLWHVDLDTKGALVATREFPLSPDGPPKAFGDWVAGELGLTARVDEPPVHLTVRIPADLAHEPPVLQRDPAGPMEVLLWDERSSAKGRTPLTWEVLKEMQIPFQLEIRVAGKAPVVIEATPGKALAKELELTSATVSLGVEQFSGPDNGISARVCNQLGTNPRLHLVSPDMLEAVRKEIEKQREVLRSHPMVQMGIRKLGVDYLLSGSVEAQAP